MQVVFYDAEVSVSLRPYQSDIIARTRTLMQKGCRSLLIQAPTGSGKTLLTAHMLHTAASKGMRSFFVVHRRELIKQSTRAFALEGVKHGIISAGFFEDRRHLVQLASVQTLARRVSRYSEPSLIVWDEAHHLAAGSWASIFGRYANSYHIGLTATPERLDGQGLGRYFKQMVNGPSVQTLIEQGYLSPYKLYAPSTVSMQGIHTRMGDYEKRELASVVDKPSITGNAIEHYSRLCLGRRAVVFCCSIEHSKHVVERFNAAGIKAAHVDGETPQEERDDAIEAFKKGDIQILSNVEIFGEGFDVPSIEAAILLRPTQSLGYYLQQVGRALRPAQGKDCAVILDHVGNCTRHGLPDQDREWSLEGRAERSRKEGGNGVAVRICQKCFAAMVATSVVCKFCGWTFPVKSREIEEKEGELKEINKEAVRSQQLRMQGSAESLEELAVIGRERGYKFPRRWAYYVFKSRQQKRLRHCG